MNILKKVFSKKEEKSTKKKEEPLKPSKTPIFDKLMSDTIKQQNDFDNHFEKIIPIIKFGSFNRKIVIDGIEKDLPESSLPVISPLSFGNLSIIFGINQNQHIEWLQNKHIEIAKNKITTEDLINKAYQNFLSLIKPTMKINMVNDYVGLIVGCQGFESSLILVNEIWDKLKQELNSTELIFGVPTQDVFLFSIPDNKEGVDFVKSKIDEIYTNPDYPKKISTDIFIHLKDGSIEIYK